MAEISVIVPVYKVENYIHECIDSILNQTFQNLEIILVDDGSPDNCGKICDDYAQKDNRVKVIHQENAGLSAARNAGIQAATGKYLCFIDSDDYISADYCQTLYNLLITTSYDYSVCGVKRFDDGQVPQSLEKECISIFTNYEYLGLQLNKQREFGVWNKLYRREIFDKILFKTGKLHEDVFWSGDLARVCSNGVIETTKECLFYRQRMGGIVSQTSEKCSPDKVEACNYVSQIVRVQAPEWYLDSLWYSIRYTWSFVDKIYLSRAFKENRNLLASIHDMIRNHSDEYRQMERISMIERKRMLLFAKSRLLYGLNVYVRLFRVYIYKLLRKDPYTDGHGI